MDRPPNPNDSAAPGGRALGVGLVILGATVLGVVFAADVGGSPLLDAVAFGLGLAWSPLLQGVGLVLVLTGAWLVWRARRR